MYGASRPFPGQTENGDSWTSIEAGTGLRVALVDGAGHGPEAAKASHQAIEVVRECAGSSLAETLRHCHTALKGTRGAVLSLVHIEDGKLEFLGVGNVPGRLTEKGRTRHLAPDRGLLGAALPSLHPQTFELTQDWVLLLCSDGISERAVASFATPNLGQPQMLADELVRTGGRQTDDATVVLILP